MTAAAAPDGPAALGAPRFVEETGAIDHRYKGDFEFFVGGGVAAFDCDGDGHSDLYLRRRHYPRGCTATRARRAVRCGSLRRRRRSPT